MTKTDWTVQQYSYLIKQVDIMDLTFLDIYLTFGWNVFDLGLTCVYQSQTTFFLEIRSKKRLGFKTFCLLYLQAADIMYVLIHHRWFSSCWFLVHKTLNIKYYFESIPRCLWYIFSWVRDLCHWPQSLVDWVFRSLSRGNQYRTRQPLRKPPHWSELRSC